MKKFFNCFGCRLKIHFCVGQNFDFIIFQSTYQLLGISKTRTMCLNLSVFFICRAKWSRWVIKGSQSTTNIWCRQRTPRTSTYHSYGVVIIQKDGMNGLVLFKNNKEIYKSCPKSVSTIPKVLLKFLLCKNPKYKNLWKPSKTQRKSLSLMGVKNSSLSRIKCGLEECKLLLF